MQKALRASEQLLPLRGVEHAKELMSNAAPGRIQNGLEFLVEVGLVLAVGKHPTADQNARVSQRSCLEPGMYIFLRADAAHDEGEVAFLLIGRPGGEGYAIFDDGNIAQFR